MRFVFFGYDYSIDIAQTLMANGHELVALFTFPCDQVFAHNTKTYALADALGIPITEKPVKSEDISPLYKKGCSVFLSAGYPKKIPPLPDGVYGLNVHPALLPRARGITPVPHIILKEPKAAGFTVHKLAPDYDCGDILYQEAIKLTDDMDVDDLSSRIGLRAPAVVREIIEHLPRYWTKAKPQEDIKASEYPAVTTDMRTLDWTKDADALQLLGRAFGRYGVIANVRNNVGEEQKLAVFQFSTWYEKHNLTPGTLLRSSPREVVISIKNGYVLLKDFQVI